MRFTFIDGLRGLAASIVVLFHALRGNHIDIPPEELVSLVVLGEAGVAIFFVISGFVIAHSLLKSEPALSGSFLFILRRSIRLDPPYWAAILLMVTFSTLASMIIEGRPESQYSLGQLVAHLFYMQEILGYTHINPVFWTLCYEVQFYAVVAVVMALRSTRLMLLLFGLSLLWPLGLAPEVRGLFVNLIYSFLMGVGAYYAIRRPAARRWFCAYALLIFGAGLVTGNLFALISSLCTALLLWVAFTDRLGTLLNWRWLQFLGMISYSLYLTHNPITGATFRVWYMIAGRSPESQVIGLLLSVVACLVFAWLFFMAIERPFIALARSAGRPSRSKGVIAVAQDLAPQTAKTLG